jgi:putative transposase
MIRYLAEVSGEVCDDVGADLVECNREDDHMHLLAGYPPKVAVSSLVNSLKGVSVRKLRQRHSVRTHLERLWAPPYLAASCRRAPPDTITQ